MKSRKRLGPRQEGATLRRRKTATAGDIGASSSVIPEDCPTKPLVTLSEVRRLHCDAKDATVLREVEILLRQIVDPQPHGTHHPSEEVDTARQRLALLLCQAGRSREAAPLLGRLGCRYRLAREVLCYSPDSEVPGNPEAAAYVAAVDDALPTAMLALMLSTFATDSAFWQENAYDCETSAYFSFLHGLDASPTTALDQVVRYLHRVACRHFPQAKAARFAEWWAHCRPHPSGHQLHFDSADEGRGGLRHPLVSSVLYLSGANVGGPTLVTRQRLPAAQLATNGWLVFPRTNRYGMFAGDVLHGVIPGRGVPDVRPGDPAPRRVTFMVAFWQDEVAARPHSTCGVPGAAEPFPNLETTTLQWPQRFLPLLPPIPTPLALPAAPIVPVAQVWEDVDPEANRRHGCARDQLTGLPPYDCCFQGF